MPRMTPVNPKEATGPAKEMLDAIKAKAGMVPNLLKTLAHSPAVLESYVAQSGAMEKSNLSPPLREQIALVVAELSGCDYCLAAHTAKGKMVGLDDVAVRDARTGRAKDAKDEAALRFATALVEAKGWISEVDLSAVRRAGFSDAEILEIVAVTMLNLFTNYFNHVIGTEIDFPKVEKLETALV